MTLEMMSCACVFGFVSSVLSAAAWLTARRCPRCRRQAARLDHGRTDR
jgi:hypothetical protein